MDARGNKLSSCKIPDQYLKKQKSYSTFRTLDTLSEKKKEKKNSEYNRVVITTLKQRIQKSWDKRVVITTLKKRKEREIANTKGLLS